MCVYVQYVASLINVPQAFGPPGSGLRIDRGTFHASDRSIGGRRPDRRHRPADLGPFSSGPAPEIAYARPLAYALIRMRICSTFSSSSSFPTGEATPALREARLAPPSLSGRPALVLARNPCNGGHRPSFQVMGRARKAAPSKPLQGRGGAGGLEGGPEATHPAYRVAAGAPGLYFLRAPSSLGRAASQCRPPDAPRAHLPFPQRAAPPSAASWGAASAPVGEERPADDGPADPAMAAPPTMFGLRPPLLDVYLVQVRAPSVGSTPPCGPPRALAASHRAWLSDESLACPSPRREELLFNSCPPLFPFRRSCSLPSCLPRSRWAASRSPLRSPPT